MNKIEARLKGIENRKQIKDRDALNQQIVDNIRSLDVYKNSKNVLIYYPLKYEVNLLDLLSDYKTFLFPVCVSDSMIAVKPKGLLFPNEYGIIEPKEYTVYQDVDLVICPLTAYDSKKNRVGFGKGFYDRYLKDKDVYKIGVGYKCQQMDDINTKDYDIKMDIIVNEENIIK